MKMKAPELEVIRFSAEDVIATSYYVLDSEGDVIHACNYSVNHFEVANTTLGYGYSIDSSGNINYAPVPYSPSNFESGVTPTVGSFYIPGSSGKWTNHPSN